ncbi:MAG: metal-transporting P-type ATPase [Planctomycetaceae bacterium]|nr:metal-transporting P-type ATPase [Planctomycetaceae bacterium]
MTHSHSHSAPAKSPSVTRNSTEPESSSLSIFRIFGPTLICLGGLIVGWLAELSLPLQLSETSQSHWTLGLVIALAYSISYLSGGLPIAKLSLKAALDGEINIDFLMLVGAAGAALIGEFSEGAVLLFLFSLSHGLETYILGRTKNAIRTLMDLSPEIATLIRNGIETKIPIDQVIVGDLVLVRPSERVPIDGLVETGRSTIDESSVTGESIPVDKDVGSKVLSGTLNLDGVLTVRVQRLADESTLARMVRLVETAQSEQATTQQFTQWFDRTYPWIVLSLSAVAFVVYWCVSRQFATAFLSAMTILVIASPCAVVISIPAAILTAIASAARGGILFKGGLAVERLAKVDAIAFDKTGTLTYGKPQVVDITSAPGTTVVELLSTAAALERDSEHPLSKALMQEALAQNVDVPSASDVQVVVGNGISGRIAGLTIRVGKVNWLISIADAIPEQLRLQIEQHRDQGQTVIGVTREREWLGIFCIADLARSTAKETLAEIRELGIHKLIMLTGDHPSVASRIAEPLNLEFLAELLPHQKLDQLDVLRRAGFTTAMIGDGMNDAPALAAADVGISLGGAGTDVALETADVIVMADDLRRLPHAIRLARQTQRIINQNLTLAFGVMGTLLLTTLVWPLPLPVAVLGHEGSTVLVILNGLRLLWFKRPTNSVRR